MPDLSSFSPQAIEKLIPALVRAGTILLAAIVLTFLINRVGQSVWNFILDRLRTRVAEPDFEVEKQATTIAVILRKTSIVGLWALAVTMFLRELGFDLAPLLAGAGIVGVAIGFGAQNLVRDVISGFFILFGGHLHINDVAVINDVGGAVEEINLRTTILRDVEGTVHMFPNGSITKLANRTQLFSYYVFDLPIAYTDDPNLAMQLLNECGAQAQATEKLRPLILAPIEVFGLDRLAETHMTIKGRIKTVAGKQWEVGRAVNLLILERFRQAGFDMAVAARRKMEVAYPTEREALKQLIQEVLDERDRRPKP